MEKMLHIPVGSQLRDYVTGVWQVDGDMNVNETILPKGIVEIIFNFSEKVTGKMPSNKVLHAPRCFIQGVNTQTIHVSYIGKQSLMGIRLHPHRVQDLLGILPSELVNTTIDLTLVKPEFNRLWHQLIELNSFKERLETIERELPVLTADYCKRSAQLSHLFHSDKIDSFQTVDDLAKEVCYSPRQLSRVTHNLFGLSAEDLAGYKKFMHAVNLIHLEKRSFTDVAYHSGFYDQSHFCRVFKSYTGLTPKQYRDQKSDLPFHIFS